MNVWQELFDPADRRYLYPYINCTNCGPRYTVILALPYDRPNTTMKPWPLDDYCDAEYHDPGEPALSCSAGGLSAVRTALLREGCRGTMATIRKRFSQTRSNFLRQGKIVAVKGLGGYHLACDARNAAAVGAIARAEVSQGKTVRGDGEGCRARAEHGRVVA